METFVGECNTVAAEHKTVYKAEHKTQHKTENRAEYKSAVHSAACRAKCRVECRVQHRAVYGMLGRSIEAKHIVRVRGRMGELNHPSRRRHRICR